MLLLASVAWPGCLAALLVGLGTGFWAGPPAGRLPRIAAALVALLALACLATALAGRVPGREGFWVESAAAMLTVYLAGCAAGGLSRSTRRARS
ncbi:hypothetical protein [Methylobacterium indicum]|uniref:hypothetical protein n=1 Tax=Methylobacterium indicum TaxID=1775910 RepID=UPI0006537FD1|nr:hypothetical protein [Methylobacterium indicum]KMO12563.1 hypothetical protein QR78_26955 [Methylobacterium indicum]